MKWFTFAFACLLAIGRIEAYDAGDDFFDEEEEMLALDSEIEALLDEDAIEPLEEEDFLPSQQSNEVLPLRNSVSQMHVQDFGQKSIPVEVEKMIAEEEEMVITPTSSLETIKEETSKSVQAIEINLRQVFAGSPIIYSILFFLSTISCCVWLYSMLTIRSSDFLPPKLIKDLRAKLISNQFDEALDLCVKQKHFFCKMLASGILARRHGLNVMLDTMKAEGKRSTVGFWQRISILNEIAIIAPMLGLLGTVLGMFYAFYDLNRSVESVSLLFDGLGISVGTTVAGLVVAILAMILYSIAKYRLVRILASVENEAQTFATLIDNRSGSYMEK